MKMLLAFIGCFVIIFLFISDDALGKSKKNKANCLAWCNNNKPRCEFCDSNAFCGGITYDVIKSFKKGTGNWYACGLSEYALGSRKNKRECNAYCKSNPACVKCTSSLCGKDIKVLKTFRGKGDNWRACQKTNWAKNTEQNRQNCFNWCKSNARCAKCSSLNNCGGGYKDIKRFDAGGNTWSACEKTGSINRIWTSAVSGVASPQHKVVVISIGGSGASSSDDGFEWFCEDYFSERNANPGVLCISSWASVTTRSSELANNIEHLVKSVERQSGSTPKLVLIGKSMGGCKLWRAHDDLLQKNVDIDLFIGVDVSCMIKPRGFTLDDAIFFDKRVNKLLNFYEREGGEIQNGYLMAYEGDSTVDWHLNINVNQDTFQMNSERGLGRASNRYMGAGSGGSIKNICNHAGHMEIDDCKKLKDIVRALIIRRLD